MDGSVELREGETVLAEGRPAALDLEIPRRVSEAEAVLGARDYPGHRRHLFPTCYCCGPERADGLRIFPGPVEGGIVAAPWVPSPSLAGEAGRVPTEIVWAALDCPAIWSVLLTARTGAAEKIVTGRIHGRLLAPVRAGEPYIVIGWPLGTEGNTLLAAAALIAPDGEVAAIARQTCVITGWGVPLDPAVWGYRVAREGRGRARSRGTARR